MHNEGRAVGESGNNSVTGAAANSPQAREEAALATLVARALAFQTRTGLRVSAALSAVMAEAEAEEDSDRRVTEEVERRLRLREEAAATLAEAEASLAAARAAMVAGRDAREAARAARSAARVLTPEQEAVRASRAAKAPDPLIAMLLAS